MRAYFAAVLACGIAVPATAASWTSFRDPNGGFTVEFPGQPSVKRSSQPAGNGSSVAMTGYSANSGAASMNVIDTDFSRYSLDATKVLDSAAAATKTSAAQTLSDSSITVDGQPGRALVIVDRAGNRVTDRIFLVKGHLYQVMGMAPAASPHDDSDRFVNSFHFVAK